MENYNLMWGDFTSNLSLTVKDLRNDADFLDVSIACEDDTIDAHKVILSAASPFFRNILKKNKHPHPYIYLNGVKLKDMKNLIDFMYNGEATVSHEDLDKFMSVAHDLKVKGLTRSDFSESSTKYLGNALPVIEDPNNPGGGIETGSRKPVASKTKPGQNQRYVNQSPKVVKASSQTFVAAQASVMVPTQASVQFQTPTYQLSVLPDTPDYTIKREDLGENSKHVYLAPKAEGGADNVITLHQPDGSANLGQLATVAATDTTTMDLNEQISNLIIKYRKEDTNKLVWRCSVCHRESDHLSNMRSHVELHIHVSRACDECGKTFNTKNSLRIHKYRNHSNKVARSTAGGVSLPVEAASAVTTVTAAPPTPTGAEATNTALALTHTPVATLNTSQ